MLMENSWDALCAYWGKEIFKTTTTTPTTNNNNSKSDQNQEPKLLFNY